jgi:hypothetical protein
LQTRLASAHPIILPEFQLPPSSKQHLQYGAADEPEEPQQEENSKETVDPHRWQESGA